MKLKQTSNDILKKIREHVKNDMYILSEHAIERKETRKVRLTDLLYVLDHGRHEQNHDGFDVKKQSWKYAIRGKTIDHVDLRVVVAFNEKSGKMVIITVMRVK